mmetsp:Transcript_2098/g.3011  ORF Transcript_2098/g.3011 Transcript_2098/m.3011 type:complete len:512 (+) Transcript_2098:341-1876(+)|eukprot:CAMPEP_0203677638 /NCGR_PEP_ID=MMETSP0090-20130426/28944_1 /ASSEMBLY_ACC=CAM_ASM_001088 /TAXON_ID=426623 /ORGANISM="Chaetoceros affinis, Strain CCMP159" /LENGTH=511 /DNA_ID=CAMNT_0050544589 /DNA_START=239 /DNA_END=1774 /DNA_ORIENTATION=+
MTEDTKEESCQSKKRSRDDEEAPDKDNGNGTKSDAVDAVNDKTKGDKEVNGNGDEKDCRAAKKARHDDSSADKDKTDEAQTQDKKEDKVVAPVDVEGDGSDGKSDSKVDDNANGIATDAKVETDKESTAPKSVFGSSVPFSGFTGLKSQSSMASASAATSDGQSVDTTKSIFGSTSSVSAGFGFSSRSSSAIGSEKGPAGTGTGTTTTGNGANTGSTSIFGKSITTPSTGFGSSQSIFGRKETSNNNGTSTSIFGSFASPPPSSSSSKKEESTTSGTGTGTGTQPKNALALPPEPTKPISNGEENEETSFTMRAKLYKLQKINDTPSPPPISIAATEGKKETGIKYATKVGNDAATTATSTSTTTTTTNGSENDQNSATSTTATALKMEWKEVGIGPLKILVSNSNKNTARIVQRRESTPGGPGTKLILNVMLREECIVEKRGDKFVKLAAFEVIEDVDANANAKNDNDDGAGKEENEKKKMTLETVQYLFKVKTVADADSLLNALKQFCK